MKLTLTLLTWIAVWFSFPFTSATWRDTQFKLPRLPKRQAGFDVLPFVLAFQIEMHSGASCRKALRTALANVNLDHLTNIRLALESDNENFALALMQEAKKYPELTTVAVAVGISEVSGARMGDTLQSMTHDVLNVRKEQAEVESELASTKATIVVLACLPLLGMVMGSAFGAHPFQWLISTSAGRMCLFIALLLEFLGSYWVSRLMKRALL